MRYVWVDANADPDFVKGDRNAVTGYFLPLGDAKTTKAALQGIAGRSRANGVYVGHNWWPGITPKEYVAKFASLFNPIKLSSTRAQFDLEQHDPAYILGVFTEARRLYPTLGLSWALESNQGGWIAQAEKDMQFITKMLGLKIRFVPSAYLGDMTRVESDIVLRDLLRRGIPEGSITMFLDGKQLGVDADGYIFTQARLP